jgi:large subunit ribosomal protein L10
MAKQIKQMEMEALRQTFRGVRDLVLFTASGIDSQTDNQMRLGLRKKNIRLQVVKNSLARRIFDEMGMKLDGVWEGPTIIAWGAESLAELSKELDALAKKNKKLVPKGAVSEGQKIDFATALKMPTRIEAIGRVVQLALSPAMRISGQLRGAGGVIAGQIKSISEKAEEAPAAEAAAPATT